MISSVPAIRLRHNSQTAGNAAGCRIVDHRIQRLLQIALPHREGIDNPSVKLRHAQQKSVPDGRLLAAPQKHIHKRVFTAFDMRLMEAGIDRIPL